MRRDALILALAIGLGGCFAPAPCADDGDCPFGRCHNGACPAPEDTLDAADRGSTDARVDAAADATVDVQVDAQVDAQVVDAALDATRDQAVDAVVGDASADMGADMGADAAPPCEVDIQLNIVQPRMDAPMARGEIFTFEVRVDPPRAEIELSAPYGGFQREGTSVSWAPRGGAPGDLPWPWWTDAVELTVTARQGACRVDERVEVEVAGDVLLFDEVDGTIWVVGSGGQLLGAWRQVPGNGVTAMAQAGGRELLAAVRQPNDAGHHLIHRLDADGEITATLAAEDFGSGDGLLLGAARSIQVLSNGLITASSTLEARLPFWMADGRLSHQLAMDGPISTLGRLGARAIFSVGDARQILATDGVEPMVEIGRNGIAPRAIFEMHDSTEFLMVAGAEWNILVRYAMGDYANLRPPPVDSDVRAVTRFREGYLVYDFRNRRLRSYDARFTHQVVPDFAPDVRQISVAGLLWLDRPQRRVSP